MPSTGPVGVYYGAEKIIEPLTVTTYHSAGDLIAAHGNEFKLLIYDEVHHLPAPAWGESALMAPAPQRLGLTATFPDPQSLSAAHWSPELLVGPVIYEKRIQDPSAPSWPATAQSGCASIRQRKNAPATTPPSPSIAPTSRATACRSATGPSGSASCCGAAPATARRGAPCWPAEEVRALLAGAAGKLQQAAQLLFRSTSTNRR